MTLDKLIAPVKYVDEQVLRYYSKLTQKWESAGRSRYSLAHSFSLSAAVSLIVVPKLLKSELATAMYGLPLGFVQGFDIMRNVFEPIYKNDTTSNGALVEQNAVLYQCKKIGDAPRLPALVIGVAMLGKGIVGLSDYLINSDASSLTEVADDFILGYSCFGYASSVYVKASDPKLLDKQPFWKTAYNWFKERTRPLVPEPTAIKEIFQEEI